MIVCVRVRQNQRVWECECVSALSGVLTVWVLPVRSWRNEALNYLTAWVSSSVWHVSLMSSELVLTDIHQDFHYFAFPIISDVTLAINRPLWVLWALFWLGKVYYSQVGICLWVFASSPTCICHPCVELPKVAIPVPPHQPFFCFCYLYI